MNDQLELKLSDLRAAGTQMRESTLQIGDSVVAIRAVLHELSALGYESPSNLSAIPPLYVHAQLTHCVDNLHTLRNQLQQTVDAVEGAMVAHFPPLGALWKPAHRSLAAIPASIPALPLVAFDPSRYVSRVNRPLYEAWRANRDALVGQEAQLQTLVSTRVKLFDDLQALRNSLSSTTGGNLPQSPEVAQLQDQIRQIDGEIIQTRGTVAQLQSQLDTLVTRLERVAPGAGATLGELHHLEEGESSAGLREYTEGCVNYVVHRIHVPAVLGRDAYLWNDIAAQNPQYGIRSGDVPLVGSVLVMERAHSYADDVYGHVMVVEKVEGGEVWITDNTHSDPVRLSDLTTETSGPNLTYLVLPWHTRG